MPLRNLFALFLSSLAFTSCTSSINKIFGSSKTAQEVYADKIEDRPGGKLWLEVAEKSLASPQSIKLPYNQLGYFPAGKPRALTLAFKVQRGERINFLLEKKEKTSLIIYADIYKKDGTSVDHLLTPDPADTGFGFDAEETGEYILRLQPELQQSGGYTLAISVAPSLGFPVAGNKAKVGGVWGDSRDNGKRNHEGIDIFAAKLTPAIAAADGYVTAVKDGGLGGKTVNLKVEGRNLSLYYAHLDKQLVQPGQLVKKGDTLGLVGNTGNAKGMSPHLHFGIYSDGAAVDPLPFVNKITRVAPAPQNRDLIQPLQLLKPVKTINNETYNTDTVLVPLALTTDGYIVELPDGRLIQASFKSVKPGKV